MRLFSGFIAVIALCSCAFSAQATAYPDLLRALEARLEQVNEALADNKSAFPDIVLSKKILKQGEIDTALPLLRARLSSYLPRTRDEVDPYVYDSQLFAAVKQYQRDVGLKDDGIIGPATLELLNRNLADEKKQIEVNIHRLKQPEWQGRPDLRIDVDIARYHLTAYENGKVAFEMPTVVGSPQRQTNRFMTVMTGVRLNPGWTLPPTIKEEDYIPKLRENPEWVEEQGVKLYASWDRDAQPIDPTTVDWDFLTDNEIKAMRFYKDAGSANPLGKFRFLMNNRYDIYLHDTNQKYLFERSYRARSSGCVRVEDPQKLAEFLLRDNPGWGREKIQSILDGGKTYNVGAKRSIPVYFDYKTAWLNDDNQLVLGADIYDLDDEEYRVMIKVQENSKTDHFMLVN